MQPQENYRQIADALLFHFGKAVLGKNAGGVILKLKQRYGMDGARRILAKAETKENPNEYVGACLKESTAGDVAIGEEIDGWIWDGGKWKPMEAAE